MAILYITEYHRVGASGFPEEPSVADQAVTFTTATASAAFSISTKYVRLSSSAKAHIKFGADPTATTSHQQIAADTEIFRAVKPGDKVSAVTAV